jgi:hypothetical protein
MNRAGLIETLHDRRNGGQIQCSRISVVEHTVQALSVPCVTITASPAIELAIS